MIIQDLRDYLNPDYRRDASPEEAEYMVIQVTPDSKHSFHCSKKPPKNKERTIITRIVEQYVTHRDPDERCFSILNGMKIRNPRKRILALTTGSTAASAITIVLSLYGPGAAIWGPLPPGASLAVGILTTAVFGAASAFAAKSVVKNRKNENDFIADLCIATLHESRGNERKRDDSLAKAAKALAKTDFGRINRLDPKSIVETLRYEVKHAVVRERKLMKKTAMVNKQVKKNNDRDKAVKAAAKLAEQEQRPHEGIFSLFTGPQAAMEPDRRKNQTINVSQQAKKRKSAGHSK